LHVAPPVFGFLRGPIFLPNKISCKNKKPTAVQAKRLIVKAGAIATGIDPGEA